MENEAENGNTVQTITCANACGWSTDVETTSDTNPALCPRCGGEIVDEGTGEHFEPHR
jgi:uncharacterized paraquat-inducible protein A